MNRLRSFARHVGPLFHRICSISIARRAVAGLAVLGLATSANGQIVANPAHNWVANTDNDGNAIWEDTGTQADRPWSLTGPLGSNSNGPARIAVSSTTSITHAYDFDGTDDVGTAAAENRSGNHNTSFELWFQPDEFPVTAANTARVLFEHGNGPRGVSLGIAGTNLIFVYAASPDTGQLTFNLDVGGDGIDYPDFIQVVGVIDDTNNQMRMYVNGGNEQVRAIATSSDFTSNDSLGLGAVTGQGAGGADASSLTWTGNYDGRIAIAREYRSAFTTAQATQNYNAIAVPEPTSSFWWFVGALGHLGTRLRLRSRAA